MPDANDTNATVIGLPGRQIKHPKPAEVNRTKKYPSPSRPSKPADFLGITIDTSVNRHRAPVPTQIFPPPPPPLQHVRSASNETSQSSLAKKRNHAPAPLHLGDISPFDRDIPIALAVPSTADALATSKSHVKPKELSPGNADTPAIILTPTEDAEHFGKQSGTLADSRRALQPRPPSSVYTRAVSTFSRYSRTPRARADSRVLSKFAKSPRTPGRHTPLKSASRMSEMTMIDCDDDSPCIVPFQKTPTSLRRPRARAASLDTPSATPHRSVGWWNLLASPIFVHTNSVRSRRGTPREEDIPEMPLLENSAAIDGADAAKHQTMPTFYYQPTKGEAATYYDPRLSFRTAASDTPLYEEGLEIPRDGQALFTAQTSASPAADNVQRFDSQRTNFTAQSGDSQKQVGSSPEPDSIHTATSKALFADSRKQTREFDPKETPPKSAAAQFCSEDELMSPVSATPVLQVASLGRFHSSRIIEPIKEEHSPNPSSVAAVAAPEVVPTSDFLQPPMIIQQPAPRQPLSPLQMPQEPLQLPQEPPRTYSPEHEETLRQLTRARSTMPPSAAFHLLTEKSPTPPPLPPPPAMTQVPYFPPPPRESSPERFIGRRTLFGGSEGASEKARGTPLLARLWAKADTMHYKSLPKAPASGRRWTKGRVFLLATGIVLLVIVLLALILSLTVHRTHADMPVQAKWVRLSDYPPLPTGISTIAGAKTATHNQCVAPNNAWACDVPVSERSDNLGSAEGAPNFRLEIRLLDTDHHARRSTSGAAHASHRVRRDAFAALVSTPSPAPPPLAEQAFLGNTSDGNATPFEGETTPFTLSLVSPSAPHARRDTSLPAPPALAPNGSAPPPTLYPLPAAQPLRLYNRGAAGEHYGFYTYYTKTALVHLPSSPAAAMTTSTDARVNALCTFPQTRLRVQIWTRPRAGAAVAATSADNSAQRANSALDFAGAGSFPLPVTLTADRHGGDAAAKGVVCYGVDAQGRVDAEARALLPEDRGALVNLAQPLTASEGVDGVDGGVGGCDCTWTNFG